MHDATVKARVHDLDLRHRLEEQLSDRLDYIKAQYVKHRTSWVDLVDLLIVPGAHPGGVDPSLTSDRLRAFCRRAGRNRDGWADPVGLGKGRKPKLATHLLPASVVINSRPTVAPAMPSATATGTEEIKPTDRLPGVPEKSVPIVAEAATSPAQQQINEEMETRKRNRELALAERRAKREELEAKWFEVWTRHVWDNDFDYNLDGTKRDPNDPKTWIEDRSWYDLP